jgi:DNA-binding Lrp family transcriptional regulator
MTDIELDDMDKRLLNVLQAEFPLTREPFADIGARLGLDEADVIRRIERLKGSRVIRTIGPSFDSRSLGYRSTLVGMSVAEDRLEKTARVVNEHPGVSHNYLRDDSFNIWFTLTVPADVDIENELQALADKVQPKRMMNLPAVRLFKLEVFFDAGGDNRPGGVAIPGEGRSLQLSLEERMVVDVLQQDLPLANRPFDAMAEATGMTADDFLAYCRRLKECGEMRRFGASVRHHAVGYSANAMVCWGVPESMVEEVGGIMAGYGEVSHCYQREPAPDWPYNMYTMVHARTKEDLQKAIDRIAGTTGIEEYRALYTVRELKKERVKLKPVTI